MIVNGGFFAVSIVSRPINVSIRLVFIFRWKATIIKYPGPDAQHYLFNDVLARRFWSQGIMRSEKVAIPVINRFSTNYRFNSTGFEQGQLIWSILVRKHNTIYSMMCWLEKFSHRIQYERQWYFLPYSMVSRPINVSIRLVFFFRRNATNMKYPGPEAQHYLFNDVLARRIL